MATIALAATLVVMLLGLSFIAACNAKSKWTEGKHFKLSLSLRLPTVWIQITTADFTHTNPEHYPSFLPKWKLTDWDAEGMRCESRYLMMFDWFFHLAVGWGKTELPPVIIPERQIYQEVYEDEEEEEQDESYWEEDEEDDWNTARGTRL